MGYSCSTPIRSSKARNEMFAFLKQHFRPWSEVTKGTPHEWHPDYDPSLFVHRDGELDYDDGKCRIGFNYSCMPPGGLDHYVYSVLRWISLRVGRRKTFPKTLKGKGAVLYIVYDGHEAWPVLPRSQWRTSNTPKEHQRCLVDVDGFMPVQRYWADRGILSAIGGITFSLDREADWNDKTIKAELSRLSRLWNDAHTG